MGASSTKFDSALTEVLHIMSLDGGLEESGSVDRAGWYARVDGSLDADDLQRYTDSDDLELDESERETLGHMVGAILHEDSQGFVYSETFTDKDAFAKRWQWAIDTDASDEDER